MLRWLEHHAYDVTYITDVDTHEDVNRLLRGKGYLSVGHDEYWSEEMRANVIQARDAGVSLGFFGGNYLYWAVALLADSNGHANRTIALAPGNGTCVAAADTPCSSDSDCPTNLTCGNGICSPATTTHCSADSDCPTNLTCAKKTCTFTCMGKPEQSLVGGNWVQSVPTNGDIFVSADAPLDHWVFANTGLEVGDVIPGLIGTEYSATSSDPAITPPGLQTLLHTPAPNYSDPGSPQYYPYDWAITIYQANSGAWVFNVATNQWSWGLDDYFTGLQTTDGANNGPAFRIQYGEPSLHPGLVSCRNPAIEQITRNVLNKFIGLP